MDKWGWMLLLLASVSCSAPEGFNQFAEIDPNGWEQSEVIHFKPQLNDSVSHFNITLQVRHTLRYPYQELWLVVALKEGSEVSLDTLRLEITNPSGHWRGVGTGTLRTITQRYKEGIQFQNHGSCALSVKQWMADKSLGGIANVGFSIEKVE